MSLTQLGKYTFLPWIRSGIGTLITVDEDTLVDPRATINVQANIRRFDLAGNEAAAYPVQSGEMKIHGPGDVQGLIKNIIIRRYPKPNTPNAEENKFALVEFSQGDFPWRFTPVKPKNSAPAQLRPWLCLIVLKQEEFNGPTTGSLLPQITILNPQNSLPDLAQIWAWAHCQITEEVNDPDRLSEILRFEPYKVTSRILCPRKLDPLTKYYAFLVPTFEAGRLASLDLGSENLSGIQLAWDVSQTNPLLIGVYDWWTFTTGPAGDFESLVRKLHPDILDETVGIRDLDLTDHNFTPEIPPLSKPLSLGGALWSKEAFEKRKQIDVFNYTVTNPGSDSPTSDEIKALIIKERTYIDIDEKFRWNIHNPRATAEDPIISLPKYGKWHAGKRLVTRITSDPQDYKWIDDLGTEYWVPSDLLNKIRNDPPYPWFEQLNLDPANRAATGLGTAIIQQLQEEIMAAAWDQAGEILAVNNLLKWAQLARIVSENLYEKSFQHMTPDGLILLTSPLHRKLKHKENNKLFHKIFQDSPIPYAFFSPAFKRLIRRRGKVHRKFFNSDNILTNNLLHIFNTNPSNPDPNPATSDDLLTFDNALQDASLELQDATEQDFQQSISSWWKKLLLWLMYWSCRIIILYPICLLLRFIIRLLFRYPMNDPLYDPRNVETFRREAENIEATIPLASDTIPYIQGEIVPLEQIHTKLLTGLHPHRTIQLKILTQVKRPTRWNEESKDKLNPNIMAYFKIKRPMYEPLRDISQELLLPGVGEIKQNIISLLQTNSVFVYSLLTGCNHETARECLWREFPTDLRGSFIRQFWDPEIAVMRERLEKLKQTGKNIRDKLTPEEEEEIVEKYRDIPEIHKWKNISLGESLTDTSGERTVLIIKGEVLRRYPSTAIYAIRGIFHQYTEGAEEVPTVALPTVEKPNGDLYYPEKAENEEVKYPIFRGTIEPDITFFGFDIPPEEVRGNLDDRSNDQNAGWFFVIQEQPSEPVFGLDLPVGDSPGAINNWNDLTWSHVSLSSSRHIKIKDANEHSELKQNGNGRILSYMSGVEWGADAADMANITLQMPVRVATHASEMVEE